GHAPVVHILAAAHRVREVDAPRVALVHIGERRRNPALGHHRVRLPEQRLADEPNRDTRRCRFDRSPKPSPARANDEHVVVEPLMTYSHENPYYADKSMAPSPGWVRAPCGGAGDFRSAVGGGAAGLGCARTMSRHPHAVPSASRACEERVTRPRA